MMGEIRVFPNPLLPFLDGGNLNASSIDMEAEDEAVIEAEPVRPKRKLIATLQVITGLTGLFQPQPFVHVLTSPQWRSDWEDNLLCSLGPHHYWALKQLVRPWSLAGVCVHV